MRGYYKSTLLLLHSRTSRISMVCDFVVECFHSQGQWGSWGAGETGTESEESESERVRVRVREGEGRRIKVGRLYFTI